MKNNNNENISYSNIEDSDTSDNEKIKQNQKEIYDNTYSKENLDKISELSSQNNTDSLSNKNDFLRNLQNIQNTISTFNKLQKALNGDSYAMLELMDTDGKMKNTINLLKNMPNIKNMINKNINEPSKNKNIKTEDYRDNPTNVKEKFNFTSSNEQIVTFKVKSDSTNKTNYRILQD